MQYGKCQIFLSMITVNASVDRKKYRVSTWEVWYTPTFQANKKVVNLQDIMQANSIGKHLKQQDL